MSRCEVRVSLVPLPEPFPVDARGLGTACVAAGLIARVHECMWPVEVTFLDKLDPVTLTPEQIVEAILRSEPDVVAFGLYAWNQHVSRRVACHLRDSNRDLLIVGGGPWVSREYREFLCANPAFDTLVHGPGERAFPDIVGRYLEGAAIADMVGIPGTAVRTDTDIICTPPAPLDIDAVPSAYRAGLMPAEASSLMSWIRYGCRQQCAYCNWSGGVTSSPVSAPRLVADLRWARNRGMSSVFVIDAAINRSVKDLDLLGSALAMADPDGGGVPPMSTTAFIDYRVLDAPRIERLKRCRLASADLGLQTINPRVHRLIQRPFSKRKFAQAVARLNPIAGITVDVMLGLPGDDLEGVIETLEFARSLDVTTTMFVLYRLPGSEISSRAADFGVTFNEDGLPYVLETSTMSVEDMREAATYFVTRIPRKSALSDFHTWNSRFARFPYNYLVSAEAYREAHEKYGDPLPPPPLRAGQGGASGHSRLGEALDRLFDPTSECRELQVEEMTVRPFRAYYPDRVEVTIHSPGHAPSRASVRMCRPAAAQAAQIDSRTPRMWLTVDGGLARERLLAVARTFDLALHFQQPGETSSSAPGLPLQVGDDDGSPDLVARIESVIGGKLADQLLALDGVVVRSLDEHDGTLILRIERGGRAGELGLRPRTEDQPAFQRTAEFDLWYNETGDMPGEQLAACITKLAGLFTELAEKQSLRP